MLLKWQDSKQSVNASGRITRQKYLKSTGRMCRGGKMSEILQESLFMNEQDIKRQPFYRGGSRANLIALQESVWRLLTSVICGPSTGVSLAKLSPCGLWLKMYGDCFQAKMDGSFEEYSEICPTWGLMLDGVLIQPPMLAPCIDESEFSLLPTIVAREGKGSAKNRYVGSPYFRGAKMSEGLRTGFNDATCLNPSFAELVMGFPFGWTDLHL